jgi:hypothetical protein
MNVREMIETQRLARMKVRARGPSQQEATNEMHRLSLRIQARMADQQADSLRIVRDSLLSQKVMADSMEELSKTMRKFFKLAEKSNEQR